jgi:hypothetical protein
VPGDGERAQARDEERHEGEAVISTPIDSPIGTPSLSSARCAAACGRESPARCRPNVA